MRGKDLDTSPRPAGAHDAEALYLSQRGVIEEVIQAVARRRGMRPEDREEFAACVRLRLVESNYEILRKYEGRASLRTYLAVVIHRLGLDYQAAQWGKWRPSAAARSGGAAAIRLEQLVVRDGIPLEAALDAVVREHGPVADRPALAALAARFPPRARRGFVGEEVLETMASGLPDVERLLIREEEEARFARVSARLGELIGQLPEGDRLVVQMHFEQGLTVARIARLLNRDQKRLYRTLEQILESLRAQFEAEGIRGVDVARLIDEGCDPDGANRIGPGRLSGSERL